MAMKICSAPCCWGVDNPENPYLPPWQRVLSEAGTAGYKGIELGPYGYLPIDLEAVSGELNKNDLRVVAGTIFDDLVSEDNYSRLEQQVHDICGLITRLPEPEYMEGMKFRAPFLVLIDWGHDERDFAAGHSDKAPRLNTEKWDAMVQHITGLAELAWKEYGVRSVIHPHAGGYIEFADEIRGILRDIPYETAGLCLDTGHSYFSGMDPEKWIREYFDRIDYIHFKDIDTGVFDIIMNKKIRFFDACAEGVMCPIGQGVIDYERIYKLLTELNYCGYITIEQERDPRNSDTSLQDVRQSLEYLTAAGF